MIEVFKTDVCEAAKASELITILGRHFPGSSINFDLDDCDRILRMAGDNIIQPEVISLLGRHGCFCETLP